MPTIVVAAAVLGGRVQAQFDAAARDGGSLQRLRYLRGQQSQNRRLKSRGR